MNKYEYTPVSKFLYRYAIAPLSLILFSYFIILILNTGRQPWMIIPAAVNLAILYLANMYYYKSYSIVPFIINADKEKLTVSNFMYGKKTVEIKYSDIDIISGGVFGYNRKGLIFIHDGANNISIGIHPSLINIDHLIKTILTYVNQDLGSDMKTRLRRWEEN